MTVQTQTTVSLNENQITPIPKMKINVWDSATNLNVICSYRLSFDYWASVGQVSNCIQLTTSFVKSYLGPIFTKDSLGLDTILIGQWLGFVQIT